MQPENDPNAQYDFIMNAGKAPRGLRGNKTRRKLIIIVVVGVILTVGAYAYSLAVSGGQKVEPGFVSLAQKQTEIIRIATIGKEKSTSVDSKILAITTELSFSSSQPQFTKVISSGGTKATPQLLGGAKDELVDTKLNAASNSGTFDQTFSEVLIAKLTDYQATIKNVQSTTSSNSEKQLLQASLAQVNTILNTK